MKKPIVSLKLLVVTLGLSNIVSLAVVAFLGAELPLEPCVPPTAEESRYWHEQVQKMVLAAAALQRAAPAQTEPVMPAPAIEPPPAAVSATGPAPAAD